MRTSLPALAGAAAISLMVAGCGFTPLYGTFEDGSSVAAALSSVSIPEQSTRIGQLIRNELLSTISPAGGEGGGAYALVLEPELNDDPAVEAFNTDIIRRTVRLRVAFQLVDTATSKVIYGGSTFSQVSYDRTGAPFANMQARTNAEERAAKEVGVDIRTRIAAYFASRR